MLTNSPLINVATAERVREVMERLDYRPSMAGRALVTQRTYLLGFFSPYVSGVFSTQILAGADAGTAESGYHILASFSHGLGEEQNVMTRFVRHNKADALIVLNLDLSGEFLAGLSRDDMPIISVDRAADEHGIPSVVIDNEAGAAEIMTHMIEHGYRDIVVMTGQPENYDSAQRLAGCRRAAREAGHELPEARILAGDFSKESGERLMAQILDGAGQPPDAVVALSDPMAIGVLQAMQDRSLRAPNDIAVSGFDNRELAPAFGLTSVSFSLPRLGEEATRLALAILSGEETSPRIVVPTQLVTRQSCGCQKP